MCGSGLGNVTHNGAYDTRPQSAPTPPATHHLHRPHTPHTQSTPIPPATKKKIISALSAHRTQYKKYSVVHPPYKNSQNCSDQCKNTQNDWRAAHFRNFTEATSIAAPHPPPAPSSSPPPPPPPLSPSGLITRPAISPGPCPLPLLRVHVCMCACVCMYVFVLYGACARAPIGAMQDSRTSESKI